MQPLDTGGYTFCHAGCVRLTFWLRALELPQPDARTVFEETLRTLEERIEQLRRYDALLEDAAERERYAPYVRA